MKFDVPGTYEVEYKAVDECGNEAAGIRNVIVAEAEPKPRTVISVSGNNTALYINRPPESTIAGTIIAEYPAMGYGHDYVFENEDDVLWKEYKDQITHVIIATGNIQGVGAIKPKSTAYWFSGCSKFRSIGTFATLDMSECVSIAHMFDGCTTRIISRTLFNDVSKVTDMSYAFRGSYIGEYGNLKTWDTSNVTNMNYAFAESPVASLDLSSWNTGKVENFENMFSGMANLTTIKASDTFTLNGWTGDMFTDDTKLVGGAGTTYIDGSSVYARIDTEENPGYFTAE